MCVLLTNKEVLYKGCKEDKARHFSVISSDKSGSRGRKLKSKQFYLNISKRVLMQFEHWIKLPRRL